jgi:hypothetical protein
VALTVLGGVGPQFPSQMPGGDGWGVAGEVCGMGEKRWVADATYEISAINILEAL